MRPATRIIRMDSIDNRTELESGEKPPDQTANPADEPGTTPASDPAPADSPVDDPSVDEYGYGYQSSTPATPAPPAPAVATVAPPPGPPTRPTAADEEEGPDEEGMLRMSFLEHLEELRKRIISALLGIGIAVVVSLFFAERLWQIIRSPAEAALREIGLQNQKLAVLTPGEAFAIIWVKLPILTAIFLASPWILYQVWAFIAPGLYKRERRWAAPFVLCSAGLFIAGGLFGYFVAFRFGLAFLLGIAVGNDLQTVISITEYFNLFVNVTLALGLVFELPVLIFFLSLLRVVTPQFLIRNSRYAILLIVVLAAIVTPTPDVVNLMLISVPMVALYFTGVFASYLLWLSRENKRFPWGLLLLILVILAVVGAGGVWLAVNQYGYKLINTWPFLVR
jgi:sec-independent protein translocase protein TatC